MINDKKIVLSSQLSEGMAGYKFNAGNFFISLVLLTSERENCPEKHIFREFHL